MEGNSLLPVTLAPQDLLTSSGCHGHPLPLRHTDTCRLTPSLPICLSLSQKKISFEERKKKDSSSLPWLLIILSIKTIKLSVKTNGITWCSLVHTVRSRGAFCRRELLWPSTGVLAGEALCSHRKDTGPCSCGCASSQKR